MKFDTNTLQVLKNFSTINKNIEFKPGNVIRTISEHKGLLAKATISDEITSGFAIEDLSRFLGTISLFDNPEVNVNGNYIEISEGGNRFSYVPADPSMILAAPSKDITLPGEDVKFTLTEASLNKVMKALGVAGLPEFLITGQAGKILIQAADIIKGATKDTYSVEVGETDKTFRFVFRSDNMKLIPGDYEVTMCSKGFCHFKGRVAEYWIAAEKESSFEA